MATFMVTTAIVVTLAAIVLSVLISIAPTIVDSLMDCRRSFPTAMFFMVATIAAASNPLKQQTKLDEPTRIST